MTGNKHKNGIICVYPGCNKSMRTQKFKLHFSRSHLRQGEEYTVLHRRKYEIARQEENDDDPTLTGKKNQNDILEPSNKNAVGNGDMVMKNGSTSLKQLPIVNSALVLSNSSAPNAIGSNICIECMDEPLESNMSVTQLDTLTPSSSSAKDTYLVRGYGAPYPQQNSPIPLTNSQTQQVDAIMQSYSASTKSHQRNVTGGIVSHTAYSGYAVQKHQLSEGVHGHQISTGRPQHLSSAQSGVEMMAQNPNPQYSVEEMNSIHRANQTQQQHLHVSSNDQLKQGSYTPHQALQVSQCGPSYSPQQFPFENFVKRVESRLDHLTNKIEELQKSQTKLMELIRSPNNSHPGKDPKAIGRKRKLSSNQTQ